MTSESSRWSEGLDSTSGVAKVKAIDQSTKALRSFLSDTSLVHKIPTFVAFVNKIFIITRHTCCLLTRPASNGG